MGGEEKIAYELKRLLLEQSSTVEDKVFLNV